jgi:hypothetical protein
MAINRGTADHWTLSSSHRARTTDLTLAALAQHPSGSLCLVGAGNCNDVSLPDLAPRATEVHLVDIDGSALQRGLARAMADGKSSSLRGRNPFVLHPSTELTGVVPLFGQCSMSASTIAERAIEGPGLSIGQPFDVIVSTSVLTQLLSLAVVALGQLHTQLSNVMLAIRGLGEWDRIERILWSRSHSPGALMAVEVPRAAPGVEGMHETSRAAAT